MPVINRIAEFHSEIAAWRRDFHANPELQYDVVRTAGKVAELLEAFGVDEVVTGVGRTGVVGVIKGRASDSGKVIGLRADMDALPITERTGKDYASQTGGKMHACGHDGHTAMLLGAARYLAETRNFDGTVVVIFQPAEEGGAGGKAMIDDGLMERFGIQEVFGMHNWPGIAAGTFAIRAGGIMASTDEFNIFIEGVGGHAAKPHLTIDPVATAAHMVTALQTVVSRNIDPLQPAVLSVTMIQTGEAFNVIPRTARVVGTIRAHNEEVRNLAEKRLREIATQIGAAFGAKVEIGFRRGYPVTVNHEAQTAFAANAAAEVVGQDKVDTDVAPSMGGEDFSYMLLARPGAYIFVGNGDTSELHTDTYDFNDEIIPQGTSYWVKLAEMAMPVKA
ncbi:M20 aminoacylase family protein [Paradevosia shaoguanensis]|uniref:M20 family metallopeptidase n=1 Tax=Paradevosia shaoguanensis TaxID=1335043 RepID=A0AA41QKU2_9HYPH|nr:M20 aminoacylase family protein [Paradevosia shaoguanensis]MCF1741549.1 M20 family metallopeptidase [Paradevosia shaoguanensis]MCI0126032.1 M20 family metallopeptidase [Paradevosia shaoguanensis]